MIIIDTREASKSQTIYNSLVKLVGQENVRAENMPVDYRILGFKGEFFIERKAVLDFVGSWQNGRIFEQFNTLSLLQEELKATSLLLIEGSLHLPVKFRRWKKESVMGLLASTVFSWPFKTICVPSQQYTILFLVSLNKLVGKIEKEIHPVEVKPKALTLDEQARRIIESFPDVGPNLALRLLEHFSTPLSVINNVEKWDEVEGIGEKIKEKAIQVLNHKFKRGE